MPENESLRQAVAPAMSVLARLITPEVVAKAVDNLVKIANDPAVSPRDRKSAARTLLQISREEKRTAQAEAEAKNADFRGRVTCLIDTQLLPGYPAISPAIVRP